MNYIRDAFHHTCKDALTPYVCLMEDSTFYGGPEEGGWWGHDIILIAYQPCTSELMATVMKDRVESLALELTNESNKAYGDQCLKEMHWLDARGLDADYLPEPDGSSCFFVTVINHLPSNEIGTRHYE